MIDSNYVFESMATAKFGMVAQWMTPDGPDLGVVVGDDDRDVIAVSAIDKSAKNEPGNRKWRDDALTAKLADLHGVKGVAFTVHRVPKPMATLVGKIKGRMLRRYSMIQDLIEPAIATAAEAMMAASTGAILDTTRRVFATR